MCRNKKIKVQTIDSLIENYFRADDYSNDNLPDVLYWCVKGIILIHILKRPITKGYRTEDAIEFNAYNELLRLSLDAVFLRLRLFTSVTEKYSGGRFLKELKDFPNLDTLLISSYGQFIELESKKKIIKLYKSVPATYNNIYGYEEGAKNPDFIHEYEREKFHQDRHSDGAKYEIAGYTDADFYQKAVARREKPTIDFSKIYCCLEQLSEITLSFCEICNFRYGNILRNCNRYHDNLKNMIDQTFSIYKYNYTADFIAEIEETLNEKMPLTLRLISKDTDLT